MMTTNVKSRLGSAQVAPRPRYPGSDCAPFLFAVVHTRQLSSFVGYGGYG